MYVVWYFVSIFMSKFFVLFLYYRIGNRGLVMSSGLFKYGVSEW